MKRTERFITTIIFISIIYVVYCYLSGVGVYKAVQYAFLTKEKYNGYVAQYMAKEVFDSFNYRGAIVRENKFVKKNLKLYMLLSLNDFFAKGIIWMNYSFEIRDNHNEIISGSWHVPFTLYVKKEGWNWRIVRKEEAP